MNISGILDAVTSNAATLGIFDRINTHEPKVAPGVGITAAVWCDRIDPVRTSGLNSSSVRLAFSVRIFTNMLAEPQDMIDPNLLTALDTLLGAYSGTFTLGGLVREVDLLGAYGPGLSAQAGYVPQDGKLYRVFTVVLPLIVNDAWSQNA